MLQFNVISTGESNGQKANRKISVTTWGPKRRQKKVPGFNAVCFARQKIKSTTSHSSSICCLLYYTMDIVYLWGSGVTPLQSLMLFRENG